MKLTKYVTPQKQLYPRLTIENDTYTDQLQCKDHVYLENLIILLITVTKQLSCQNYSNYLYIFKLINCVQTLLETMLQRCIESPLATITLNLSLLIET